MSNTKEPRTIAAWKALAEKQAAEIQSLRRTEAAYREWIMGEDSQAGTETFDVPETEISVTVMRVRSVCGGVARVRVGSTALLPEMLDDLLADWLADRDPNIRSAANRIAAFRERMVNSPFPAELTGGAS